MGIEFAATALQRGAASRPALGRALTWWTVRPAPPPQPVYASLIPRRRCKPWPSPSVASSPARSVAITGSNGKTTVKEMTAAVLQQRYAHM